PNERLPVAAADSIRAARGAPLRSQPLPDIQSRSRATRREVVTHSYRCNTPEVFEFHLHSTTSVYLPAPRPRPCSLAAHESLPSPLSRPLSQSPPGTPPGGA